MRLEGRLKFVGDNLFPAKNPVDAHREVVHLPPSAHFQLFGGEKKVPPLQTQRHNLSNNYIEMERRNDGNFLITRQISSALQTKIARAL